MSPLNDCTSPAASPQQVDWTSASIPELIEHIISVHHSHTRELISAASALALRISIFPATEQIRDFTRAFHHFKKDLIAHLDHEEKVLFPACLALDRSLHHVGGPVETTDVALEVHLMSTGHDSVRADIIYLVGLSQLLEAGNKPLTTSSLRLILGELDADLAEHGRIEEGILLPAVLFQQDLSLANQDVHHDNNIAAHLGLGSIV